ncbi:MAG: flavin reductase [Lachnospiraceae bacterium]|nr:flavin reductase [Lachnospiraceae bacterium]MBQ7259856.1 flavin reductase [Lachnospiraceae bacterium]HAV00569.1 flavin reductase [Lachnospiraceae bacterium]
MDNKTMYKLSYGLFVLTAKDEKDNGCITNTAIQVTSEPNRISLAVNKSNYTHDMIIKTGIFTVSIISEDADFELFKHFGFQSGRDVDKFEGFADCKRLENGTLAITKGVNGYICGKVINTVDLGTHTLFIADVTDMEVLSDTPSATYTYYQSNIKPKPQAASAEEKGKTVWRCKICGYEYEGEELPADFVCPVCKHPASDFEKVVK